MRYSGSFAAGSFIASILVPMLPQAMKARITVCKSENQAYIVLFILVLFI
jgi:hypothetical protein